MKKKTVTIGIPVFNEGKNIRKLLEQILLQKANLFILEKILVVSDGSIDNTVREALTVKDKRIVVEDSSFRIGKVKRLNYIFESNKSDILIQLDGDIELKNNSTIEKLIIPFLDNDAVSIVYGNQVPIKPKTYIGKLAYFGFYNWEEAKKMVNSERYNCFGCITAFSSFFLNRYKLPIKKVYFTEDTYSFYYAKKYKYKTHFKKDAVAYFSLPLTLNDYVKQMNRYLTTSNDMKKFFGRDLIEEYETITPKIKLMALLKSSLSNSPDIVLGYLGLQFVPKFRSFFYKEKVIWDMIKTSKKVNFSSK